MHLLLLFAQVRQHQASTRFPPSSLLPFISASSDWEQGKACCFFSFYGNSADLWMTEWKDGLNFTVLGCQCAMYRRNVPHFYPNMLVILGEYSQRIEGSGRERDRTWDRVLKGESNLIFQFDRNLHSLLVVSFLLSDTAFATGSLLGCVSSSGPWKGPPFCAAL